MFLRKKGKSNIGFLKKIKFWKKRNNNTPTKVDACVSTLDPRTCDAATVSMDPTVMCAAYTQRPGWMMVVLLLRNRSMNVNWR
jgi:hypothetical protein